MSHHLDLFAEIATEHLLEQLSAEQRAFERIVIDSLPPAERQGLFSSLLRRTNGQVTMRLGPEGDQREVPLAAVPLRCNGAAVDLLPVRVLGRGEEEDSGLGNQVSEGFSCSLRDYFTEGAERPRVLLVFTAEPNETQRSASEPLSEGALVDLPSLARRLLAKRTAHLSPIEAEPLRRVVEYYISGRHPHHELGQHLARVDAYLGRAKALEPSRWGTALDALGYLPDSAPDFVGGEVPDAAARLVDGKIRGRLDANAKLAHRLRELFDDPLEDEEQAVRGHFETEAAEALLAAARGEREAADLAALVVRADTGKRERNNFDEEGIALVGPGAFRLVPGKENDRQIVVVASPADEVVLDVPLKLPCQPDREYFHLLQWDGERNKPYRDKALQPEVAAGERVARFRVPCLAPFAVFRVAMSKGPRSFSAARTLDAFTLAVHHTTTDLTPVEHGLNLSLEHQAWRVEGDRALFRFDESGRREWPVEQQAPESSEALGDDEDGVQRFRHERGKGRLPLEVAVFWSSADEVDVSGLSTVDRLESLIFERSLGGDALRYFQQCGGVWKKLGRRDRLPEGYWDINVGSLKNTQVRAWDDNGEEQAVARLLADPALIATTRHGDDRWEDAPASPAFVARFGALLQARRALFEKLAARAVIDRKTGGERGHAALLLTHLGPLKRLIGAYLEAWLEVGEQACSREQDFTDAALNLLMMLDTYVVRAGQDDHLERLVLLPTHPWLLYALLQYQELVDRAIKGVKSVRKLPVTRGELDQLAGHAPLENWYAPHLERRGLVGVESAPFHLAFVPAQRQHQSGGRSYIARVVRHKIRRYLEMHPHLRSSRRRLRLGFVNPGDAGQVLAGIQLWLKSDAGQGEGRWEERVPALDLLLVDGAARETPRLGAELDNFFRAHLASSSGTDELQTLLQRLRYEKRRLQRGGEGGEGWPGGEEDFVHICFYRGLVSAEQQQPKETALDDGWDGCFADGLLATPLRRTRVRGDQQGIFSERGLWVSDDRRAPLRRGLRLLLMLLRRARNGTVAPNKGLCWRVELPRLDELDRIYGRCDWVVHLDQELNLQLFEPTGEGRPLIIEYSDQEEPLSPGYDTITVTNKDEPYRDQLRSVLHVINLVPSEGDQAENAARAMLRDINAMSGSWALEFILGNIGQAGMTNRLKGNVGSALVDRWMQRVEGPELRRRYGEAWVPLVVTLEELIRATPASGLSLLEGLAARYSNENEGEEQRKWCDDLLVLYLPPAREDRRYRAYGRIVEVKLGTSATAAATVQSAVNQVRGTQRLLQTHMAGGAGQPDAAFRNRQLALLIKAQLEQAEAFGRLEPELLDRLNLPVLSRHLAAGTFDIRYRVPTRDGAMFGDAFLLSTAASDGGASGHAVERPVVTDGVRVVTMHRPAVRALAFAPDDAPTLTTPAVQTLPRLPRVPDAELAEGLEALEGAVPEGEGAGKEDAAAVSGELSPGTGAAAAEDAAWASDDAAKEEGESDAGAATALVSAEPADSASSVAEEGWSGTPDHSAVSAASSGGAEDGALEADGQGRAAEATAVQAEVADEALSLAEACTRPVKEAPYPREQVERVIESLEQELLGHGIRIEEPPSAAEAELGPRLVRAYLRLSPGQSAAGVRRISEDIARRVGTLTEDINIFNAAEKHAVALDLPVAGMSYSVVFDEILGHPSFAAARRELSLGFCAGVEVTGKPVWADLSRMPHMLVAGTTGSGKTIFLRTVLLTLAMHRSPAELELRLSSSKPMDFKPFTKLPHARGKEMASDPHAALALVESLVLEMDRRIELISDEMLENLEEYNEEMPPEDRLPRIVAVLDEFSETVLSFADKNERRQFEDAVGRLAQKARAAGIHLILCMQRPDATVLQGAIKSNVLHRFALKLPQHHDSRIILDENGAEKLLGKGDLLYKNEAAKQTRLQVPYLEPKLMRTWIKKLAGE